MQTFGSFVIRRHTKDYSNWLNRPTLSCSHWLEIVYTQNAAMMSFLQRHETALGLDLR